MKTNVHVLKINVPSKSNDHICGYCQSYLEHKEPAPLTLDQVHEIETRLSQGWRLRGDMQHLIRDIKHYLAQQSQ
ncbi:MAG: hypothetical protein WAW10_06620 [Gallionella sp.]